MFGHIAGTLAEVPIKYLCMIAGGNKEVCSSLAYSAHEFIVEPCIDNLLYKQALAPGSNFNFKKFAIVNMISIFLNKITTLNDYIATGLRNVNSYFLSKDEEQQSDGVHIFCTDLLADSISGAFFYFLGSFAADKLYDYIGVNEYDPIPYL